MNSRYSESWKSESPQNTTCSYFTGTTGGCVREPETWASGIRKLTVLREQVVRSSDNELGHESAEFLQLLLGFFFDFIGRVRITAANNGIFEILPEVAL